MLGTLFSRKERSDVPCTVEIENTYESLHAHVVLDGNILIEPGDEVIVHGEPIKVPYGEKAVIRRTATVIRAGWLERKWTRLTGDLEFMELCEFSFSSGGRL
ncbi:MAG: hypothetical protein NW217_04895 [Hyphomicrobiaceae bacterium]|nr:hypothetical protein [Hyphomicrobiaceae bacterium]